MGKVRNILWIMCDQLRADYLSCEGHPTLATPTIDRLARRGVRFTRAYSQSPVCGPSRMSFYTGRYMSSHGATWNNVPLEIGERTLGDYLRPAGLRVALVGKTHMRADLDGMKRLGIDPCSPEGILLRECGFEPYERDDGLHPDGFVDPHLRYNRHLRERGYAGGNLWHEIANSAEAPDGEILSGWLMRHANLPARVREEDSETAYMTDRAIAFVDEMGERPWCLHLSYIKPHWPYMAPAPYHAMHAPQDVLPANRDPAEIEKPHPVYAAYLAHGESRTFRSEEVRRTVIPTYMGLVRQIDDHLGRLLARLERLGRMDDTLIVFTSDHGDYLGDHWLGEKELFHETSARIPLIVCDPDPQADPTRGSASDRLVEAIDLVPTFMEAAGLPAQPHRLEGRSLLPLIRGPMTEEWREAAFSELDYGFRGARLALGLGSRQARAAMVCTGRWKYVHYRGFRPQLFDLAEDPQERHDLGEGPGFAAVRDELHERLFDWMTDRRARVTLSDAAVDRLTNTAGERGIHIGVW